MSKLVRNRRAFKTSTFHEFKEFTLAVVRGERQADPNEPKVWVEEVDASDKTRVHFQSLEAGQTSVGEEPGVSVHHRGTPAEIGEKLAVLTHRAEQNLLCTLHKLSGVGLVRPDKGAARAYNLS